MRPITTPNVRTALRSDPVEAMTVESLTRGRDGSLLLFADSWQGPFKAIYRAPGEEQTEGHRAEDLRLSVAVRVALEAAA